MQTNTFTIVDLSFDEIEQVDGAELTAAEVRDIGARAVGTGAAIAAVPGGQAVGAAVAAAGATAFLIGGLIDGMGAG